MLPLSPPYRCYLLDGEGIGGQSAGLDYFIFKYGSSALGCEVLRMLINAGAKVKGPESISPLRTAIDWDNTAAVQMLLEAGAEADIPPSAHIHAWAPLHYAVFFACPEIINLLIKHGADVHRETEGIRAFKSTKYRDLKFGTRFRGSTPLNLAVQANHVGAVEALIDAGADIERADSRGKKPRDFVRTDGTTHPRIAERVAPRPSVAEQRGDASVYADMSGQYTEMSSWKHPAT
ncbi:ankyrin repeat domain-containing protein [bacterium]|nr:ankyrin repeat domain-containing protein [bacterium]